MYMQLHIAESVCVHTDSILKTVAVCDKLFYFKEKKLGFLRGFESSSITMLTFRRGYSAMCIELNAWKNINMRGRAVP